MEKQIEDEITKNLTVMKEIKDDAEKLRELALVVETLVMSYVRLKQLK